MIQTLAHGVRAWLASRHLAWQLALLAILLCLPALSLGRLLDDNFHRASLTRPDLTQLARSPAELFAFVKGEEAANRWSISVGFLPWWAHENLRVSFFRPVTGYTHWLDYRLWPDSPWVMHLHSLAWFGVVVAAVTVFYRRMFRYTWVAGMAALLFAVDDAHGLPAVWLANRNALIGALFGLLTLIAHDRWRRDGQWLGAVLAPLALLLGILSKESVAAVGAYLFAYAVCLERGRWLDRLASLLPCGLVGLAWWITYTHLGYGAAGSGWYLDPGAEPARFALSAVMRAPTLLAWQWLVPSDLQWELSPSVAQVMWLAAMGLLAVIAVALASLLKRDGLARFWAVGMLLSVLPACGAFPSDRLLFFVGLGGMGLLAQFIASVARGFDLPGAWRWRHLPARALCVFLVFIHLAVAPWMLAGTAKSFDKYGRSVSAAAASLPSDPLARVQTVLVVSTPAWASFAYGALLRVLNDDPYLSPTIVLGSGGNPVELHRQDERTLRVRPEHGYLSPPGVPGPWRDVERLLFDQRCAILSLDRIYRDDSPMTVGQRIEVLGMTVEVSELTTDGRPAEVVFHFRSELQNPFYRWLKWADGEYVPFVPPNVGETVTMPAVGASLR